MNKPLRTTDADSCLDRSPANGGPRRTLIRWLSAGAVLNLLWLVPDALDPRTSFSPRLIPELWLLVSGIGMLPAHPVANLVRFVFLVLSVVLWLAALGNVAVQVALGRSLTLPWDVELLRNGFELLQGQFGLLSALGASAVAIVLPLILVVGLAKITRRVASIRVPAVLATLAGSLVLLGAQVSIPGTSGRAWAELDLLVRAAAEQRERLQRLAAAIDTQPGPTAMDALAGRDVWLVWIESYGARARDAASVRSVLERHQPRLHDAGFTTATGELIAPIRGGQSWLSHATLLTGLEVGDQAGYRRMLAGNATTLVDDFRRLGHATAAIMPAIVQRWPEGFAMGFEQVFDASALDYRGPGLGWVTMPDEFTLRRAARQIRPQLGDPAFIQIALISSHAPWHPVLPLLGPGTPLDDGRAFQPWVPVGPEPGLRDSLQRLRARYHAAIAYSLDAVLSWALESMGPTDLLVLVGDHPPPPLILGQAADAKVPMHVISRDQALLDMLDTDIVRPGLLPAAGIKAQPMSAVRDWLHRAYARPETTARSRD